MSEEFVSEALNALRRADAGVDTGPEAEIRALLAFRRQRRQRRVQRIALWTSMAAAAVIALVLLNRPAVHVPDGTLTFEAPAETAPAVVQAASPEPPPVKHSKAQPEEIATGFFPLMDNPPRFERASLLRVTVPASTMRAVGLPVGDDHLSDPVQADLLVGQDDLARAIRFVSSKNIRD